MENFDWVYLIVAALAGIGSLTKAIKKRQAAAAGEETSKPPVFSAQDILRKVMEEMKESDDDFFPRTPTPQKQVIKPTPAATPKPSKTYQAFAGKQAKKASWDDDSADSTENKPRRDFLAEDAGVSSIRIIDEEPAGFLANVNLSDEDELKKVIIYNEILRPKF